MSSSPPTAEEVERLLERSVRIQTHRELFTAEGRRRPQLALYWQPNKRLVFKIDNRRKVLVSVLTPKCLKEREAS